MSLATWLSFFTCSLPFTEKLHSRLNTPSPDHLHQMGPGQVGGSAKEEKGLTVCVSESVALILRSSLSGKSRGKDMSNILGMDSDEEKEMRRRQKEEELAAAAAEAGDGRPPPVVKKKAKRRLTMLDSDDNQDEDDSEEFQISE